MLPECGIIQELIKGKKKKFKEMYRIVNVCVFVYIIIFCAIINCFAYSSDRLSKNFFRRWQHQTTMKTNHQMKLMFLA